MKFMSIFIMMNMNTSVWAVWTACRTEPLRSVAWGKTYAVTGWRIGWAAAHKDLSALIRKVHDYLTVCAPAPFQKAGITALALPLVYYGDMRRKYALRREILLDALSAAGFKFTRPGGCLLCHGGFQRDRMG